jgi:hypothetical protein
MWGREQLKCEEGSSWNVRKGAAEVWGREQLKCEEGNSWSVRKGAAEVWWREQLNCEEGSSWNVRKGAAEMLGREQLKCEGGRSWNVRNGAAEVNEENNCCWSGFNFRIADRAFEAFRKIVKSDSLLRHVCLSFRPYVTTRLPLKGFSWNLGIFRKSVEKIQVLLKSDNNNRYFTWRPIQISDHISLSSSYNDKCFIQSCRENQNTHFVFGNFVFDNRAVCEIMWKNNAERGRPKMTVWLMHIACRIPKARHTHRLCNTRCFSTTTMVVRKSRNVALYIYTLPVFFFRKF